MKRLGFTLSEVIIALGIVGVIAAITAPLISGIIPDKSKVAVLKAYKMLNDVNEDLLSDMSLYITDGNCKGFNCTQRPLNPAYNDAKYEGANKYRNLLADKFNVSTISGNKITTKDGTVWTVNSTSSVDIDINPNGKNCTYNKTSCKNPDQFKFSIDSTTGKVSGNDALTKAYLANPYKLNDRKKDLKSAGG